jgi:hypothetical protein
MHEGEPVHIGHLVINQGHVGALGLDQLEAFTSVTGLTDHPDLATVVQAARYAVTEERVIVNDDHPYSCAHLAALLARFASLQCSA